MSPLGLSLCLSLSLLLPASPAQATGGELAGTSAAVSRTHGLQVYQSGISGAPVIVFVHGTPGSGRQWRRYLAYPELRAAARLVAVDRPGWGGSTSEDGAVVASFAEQAVLLARLLERLRRESGGPLILVGHSLGASLIPQIYLQYPALVDGMLLINGSVDPDLAAPRWYHRLADTWLVGRMIGRGLRKANAEMLALAENLERQRPVWKQLDIPVILIQGGKDFLVNPDNVAFVQARADAGVDVRFYPDKGHFIPFRAREVVVGAIQDLLSLLRPEDALVYHADPGRSDAGGVAPP